MVTSAEHEFYLKYEPGEWTEPPGCWPEAWPYACTDEQASMIYFAVRGKVEVWECQTRQTRPALVSPRGVVWFRRGYAKEKAMFPVMDDGIVQCQGIKPVRRIA